MHLRFTVVAVGEPRQVGRQRPLAQLNGVVESAQAPERAHSLGDSEQAVGLLPGGVFRLFEIAFEKRGDVGCRHELGIVPQ